MPGSLELSILIPVYNQPVTNIVKELLRQAGLLGIKHQILCYDDASTNREALKINKELSNLKGVSYIILPKNLGRSAIRNLLANDAQYPTLLFLDCDVVIPDTSFLHRYSRYAVSADVICGGHIYNVQPPASQYLLHWYYGTYRESQPADVRRKHPFKSFMFSNVFISKKIFMSIKLDESIKTYGHEDSRFGYELERKNIPVLHIENPVIHIGLDTTDSFLKKTKQGVQNLSRIYKKDGLAAKTSLIKTWRQLSTFKLSSLFCLIYDVAQPLIHKNLFSKKPKLRYLDLYKLRILCQAMKN
jgi:glycosyltransferase involved in cell wall biosynthesis